MLALFFSLPAILLIFPLQEIGSSLGFDVWSWHWELPVPLHPCMAGHGCIRPIPYPFLIYPSLHPTPCFIPMLQYSSSSSSHAGMAVHGHTKLPSLHPNPATSMQTPISMPIPPLTTFFFSMPAYPRSLTPPCAQVLFSGWERATAKRAFHSPQTSPEPPLEFDAATPVRDVSL